MHLQIFGLLLFPSMYCQYQKPNEDELKFKQFEAHPDTFQNSNFPQFSYQSSEDLIADENQIPFETRNTFESEPLLGVGLKKHFLFHPVILGLKAKADLHKAKLATNLKNLALHAKASSHGILLPPPLLLARSPNGEEQNEQSSQDLVDEIHRDVNTDFYETKDNFRFHNPQPNLFYKREIPENEDPILQVRKNLPVSPTLAKAKAKTAVLDGMAKANILKVKTNANLQKQLLEAKIKKNSARTAVHNLLFNKPYHPLLKAENPKEIISRNMKELKPQGNIQTKSEIQENHEETKEEFPNLNVNQEEIRSRKVRQVEPQRFPDTRDEIPISFFEFKEDSSNLPEDQIISARKHKKINGQENQFVMSLNNLNQPFNTRSSEQSNNMEFQMVGSPNFEVRPTFVQLEGDEINPDERAAHFGNFAHQHTFHKSFGNKGISSHHFSHGFSHSIGHDGMQNSWHESSHGGLPSFNIEKGFHSHSKPGETHFGGLNGFHGGESNSKGFHTKPPINFQEEKSFDSHSKGFHNSAMSDSVTPNHSFNQWSFLDNKNINPAHITINNQQNTFANALPMHSGGSNTIQISQTNGNSAASQARMEEEFKILNPWALEQNENIVGDYVQGDPTFLETEFVQDGIVGNGRNVEDAWFSNQPHEVEPIIGQPFTFEIPLSNSGMEDIVGDRKNFENPEIVSHIIQFPQIHRRDSWLRETPDENLRFQNIPDPILGKKFSEKNKYEHKKTKKIQKETKTKSKLKKSKVSEFSHTQHYSKKHKNLRNSRSLPLMRLVADPNAKLDMPKTIQNVGTIAKTTFEDKHAPMYHVRNLVGSSKNALLSALRIAPQGLIIPSQYKIIDTTKEIILKPDEYQDLKTRANSHNLEIPEGGGEPSKPLTLKEKFQNFLEERLKATRLGDFTSKLEPKIESPIVGQGNPEFLNTFQKIGNVIKESIQSGQAMMDHVSEAAHSARKVLTTSQFALPRVLLPYTKAAELKPPEQVTLITPRFLDVAQDEHPPPPNNFVGMGDIMDALGISNPDQNKVGLRKYTIQRNEGPFLQSRFGDEETPKPTSKYIIISEDLDSDDNNLGNAWEAVEGVKNIIGAGSVKDFLVEMQNDFTMMKQKLEDKKNAEEEFLQKIEETEKEKRNEEDHELQEFLQQLFKHHEEEGVKIKPNLQSRFGEEKEEEMIGAKLELPNYLYKPFMRQPSKQEVEDYFQEHGDTTDDLDNPETPDDFRRFLEQQFILSAINPSLYQKLFNETLVIKPNSTISDPQSFFDEEIVGGANSDVEGEEKRISMHFHDKLNKPFLGKGKGDDYPGYDEGYYGHESWPYFGEEYPTL